MPLPFERKRIAIADFHRLSIHVLLVIMRGDILSPERGSRIWFMKIRAAESSDLESASQLWFDRMNLLQQTDWQIKLLPDAKEDWRTKASSWIADDQVRFLVAENNEELIGLIAVGLAKGMPGLYPQRKAVLLDMAVDLHATHRGLGKQLLDMAKRWLSAKNVTELEVDVPAHYPVETAFWRAQGAELRFERRWLRI